MEKVGLVFAFKNVTILCRALVFPPVEFKLSLTECCTVIIYLCGADRRCPHLYQWLNSNMPDSSLPTFQSSNFSVCTLLWTQNSPPTQFLPSLQLHVVKMWLYRSCHWRLFHTKKLVKRKNWRWNFKPTHSAFSEAGLYTSTHTSHYGFCCQAAQEACRHLHWSAVEDKRLYGGLLKQWKVRK